jgi:hypothetical protein
VAAAHVVVQRLRHERCRAQQPVDRDQAAAHQLSERQAAAVPGRRAVRRTPCSRAGLLSKMCLRLASMS